MATFINTDSSPSGSIKGLDIEALARAGNSVDFSTPEPEARKATLRRPPPKGNRQYRPSAPSTIDEEGRGPSASVTQRKLEISAEPITQHHSSAYRKTLVAKDSTARALIRKGVDECLLFSGLHDAGKNEVVDAFRRVEGTLSQGHKLIEEGDWGDLFFVLQSGTCEATKGNGVGRVKIYDSPGSSFGELALMYNEPRAATVTITSETAVVWSVDRMSFKNISVHFKVLKQKQYEESLRAIPGIAQASSDEMTRLVDSVEERVFEANTKIVTKGDKMNEVLVILDGKAFFKTDSESHDVNVGDMFGVGTLMKEDVADFSLHTGKDQRCTIMTLSRIKAEEALGSIQFGDTPLMSNRPKSMAPSKLTQTNNNLPNQHKYHIQLKFEDLEMKLGAPAPLLSPTRQSGEQGRMFRADTVSSSGGNREDKTEIVLGVGTFGKVLIVRHAPTGETYALKRLNKSWIVENSLEQHVVDERNVMTLTDHPFILKLHNSFYDERYVYLLLELCLGGELFFYLRKFNRFNEQQARFYVASITLAFEHLHAKNIIYRDLKPENLMLDDKGFLKVVDFGLAKVVKGRTWTICGTPEYLAPEVVLSKGHNRGVDWWGLGILIFELTAGYCPFVGDDNMVVYRLIVENKIDFPPHTTPQLRDICKDFTRSSQLVRLGLRRPGTKAIMDHPWFTGFDWTALQNLSITPPIQTKVRNKADVSNFEEYTGSEQDLYEAMPCDWQPAFPYQVIDGRTVLTTPKMRHM